MYLEISCFNVIEYYSINNVRLSRSSSTAQLSKPQKFNFQQARRNNMTNGTLDKATSNHNITKVINYFYLQYYKKYYPFNKNLKIYNSQNGCLVIFKRVHITMKTGENLFDHCTSTGAFSQLFVSRNAIPIILRIKIFFYFRSD